MEKISGRVSGRARVGGSVAKGGGSVPTYTGEYEITPKTYEESLLPTKDKRLTENVSVKRIPQYEVSNQSGGETLIIGDEYYGS